MIYPCNSREKLINLLGQKNWKSIKKKNERDKTKNTTTFVTCDTSISYYIFYSKVENPNLMLSRGKLAIKLINVILKMF